MFFLEGKHGYSNSFSLRRYWQVESVQIDCVQVSLYKKPRPYNSKSNSKILHGSSWQEIPVPSSPAEERNDLEIWWIFSFLDSLLKSLDFINFRSPQRWSPQTCTVARGDPCHFVDAVNEFTLIHWLDLQTWHGWNNQDISRYDVGFFFVEVFTSKRWFRHLLGFARVLPRLVLWQGAILVIL